MRLFEIESSVSGRLTIADDIGTITFRNTGVGAYDVQSSEIGVGDNLGYHRLNGGVVGHICAVWINHRGRVSIRVSDFSPHAIPKALRPIAVISATTESIPT